MKLIAILGFLLLGFGALPARAALPEEILNRDYRNCMGTDKEAKHAIYCECVREGMRSWSENAYIEAMMQVLAAASGKKTTATGSFDELTKKCLAQAFR
ncbi:MAG: hypothetical protein WC521_05575 [Bdellovibrionales bacterium]|jgi:hypothetical protein